MSESPTRFQTAAPPPAEIRSLAIAKLKRAASLPRTPDGRRQPQPRTAGGPSATASEDSHGASSSLESGMTPSPTKGALYGDEELLASSPAGHHVFGGGTSMQRSGSESSSFNIPTPPHMAYSSANASPFFTAQASPASTPGTDWAAYQLAQSYLPSISPVPPSNGTSTTAAPPSSFPGNLTTPGGGGRNTPSPLPSLGELRNLSRSNSAAARQNAMNKLIGGAVTPTKSRNVGGPQLSSSEEDVTLSLPGSTRGALHRSGTIGVPRMFGMPAETAVDDTTVTPIPDTAYDVPRPRLQRSFTVSSSNMGEERRSAVGRRMVERLGARRAARQQEDSEVRQLWEERRRTRGSQKGIDIATPDGTPPRPAAPPVSAPAKPPPTAFAGALAAGAGATGAATFLATTAVADRTPSRSTQRSDVFEYESHLKRNASARTARTEALDGSPVSDSRPLFEDMGEIGGEHGVDDPTPLEIPELPFATPTKHSTHESISSSATTVMGKGLSPATVNAERMPSPADPFESQSYPSSNANGSLYNDHSQHNGHDQWNGRSLSSRQDTYSMAVDTNAGHHGHDDSDSAYYSDAPEVRPSSKASGRESSTGSHIDPSVYRHHKKTSSLSKMGRAVLAAAKTRISSASNDTPPLSPRESASPSRRPSDASNSQSQHSLHSHRGVSPAPEPRYGKLTPPLISAPKGPAYKKDESAETANNLLIQHQLSGAPSPVSFLPRANPNDPRIQNSKLSPFPGIAALESRSRQPSDEQPRLIQQTSDPTLPTTRGMSPQAETGRGSNDSGSKRRIGLPTTGASVSSHGSESAHGTYSSSGHSNGHYAVGHSRGLSHSQSDDHRNDAGQESLLNDAEAGSYGAATDLMRSGSNIKQRPEIPSFMMNRRRAPPPPPIEVAESNVVSINDDPVTPPTKFKTLPPRSRDVLHRLDGVLSLPPNDPSRPDFLDDPPRKLLLSQQVLQVVNPNTVKDRYLFLFNDILVIAKPVMASGTTTANLDMKFVVKSIVSLDKIVISGLTDDQPAEPTRHPAVQQFIQHFAEDSVSAVHQLVERSAPRLDNVTLAGMLFKTNDELDKTQLGILLASDPALLQAYTERFDFELVRIDEALRLFLLAVRLPSDIGLAKKVLRGFADGYIAANEHHVTYDMALAEGLVLSTLELNDMLYSTFGFAFPNHAISRDTFVQAFEEKDPNGLVPTELLEDIYTSIRGSKLVQALASHETHLVRELVQTPARLPANLTYNEWSETFHFSIPKPDPQFKIKLVGTGLELDPPVLDFSRSKDVSFRVRGTKLGMQTMLFDRIGANSALYASLGNARAFNVERAFMRNTFNVSFVSPTGAKRKYCFSVCDAATKQKWGGALNRQIWLATVKKQQQNGASSTSQLRVQRSAEAVALQVLRDALLAHEDKASEDLSGHASPYGQSASPGSKLPSSIPARVLRQGSVSIAYSKSKAEEADLGPLQPTKGHSDSLSGMVELQTGKELVLLCRQNSLLPSVLTLLQRGTGTDAPDGQGQAKAQQTSNNHGQKQTTPPQQSQKQSSNRSQGQGQPQAQAQVPARAAHLQQNAQQPKRSAGLRAMMHDRRL